MFIIFIPVYMFLFLPLRMVLVGETKGFLRAAGTTQWGLMTTVFSLSHLAFLLTLRPAGDSPPPGAAGPGLVLFLATLTQLNDVSQFVWGKSFGRRRIAPTVSPNKTWAGFLGGVATTVALAAVLGPALTPMGRAQSILGGLLIAVFGFCGDLVMAAIKRDMGVKDYGSTLPGHGGVLDRVNSLTFTAPLFFHYVWYLFEWRA
jgi:phosphatidate cytidylyltransferase